MPDKSIADSLHTKESANMLKRILPLASLLLAMTMTVGCDDNEDVIEIETPDGSVDVERDKDTNALDVDINN